VRGVIALAAAVLAGGTAVAAASTGAPPAATAASTGAPARDTAPSPPAALPTTSITVNGSNGGGRAYGGAGAVLGGGGTARYLEEYPAAERKSILRYLFQPGYGASLQLLKLEIGGDTGTAAGSEPSIEQVRGQVDCNAGYELAIARQAAALSPGLKLYGLQWGAPAWVGHNGSLFTSADIGYLLDWLGCAKSFGLTVSYLGGWDEADNGQHAAWFASLRAALDAHGYSGVQLVAADGIGGHEWEYLSSPAVAILGAHNNCGYPTGDKGPQTKCFGNGPAARSGKPLWASELGGTGSGWGPGCKSPCAPAIDRVFTREYIDARVTAEMVWPALISMPATVLRYYDRGLVTADQPWSGNYQVNPETWALAHFTQFAWPPSSRNPGGWRYEDAASGYLRGTRAGGSYVTLVRSTGDQWSTVIETTAGVTRPQRVRFTVRGGHGLASKTVHVWSSDFSSATGGPRRWLVHARDIRPVHGQFTLTAEPGYVYSLTTTTGQGKGTAGSPRPAPLRLPYRNAMSSGQGGEPAMLAAQDGSFGLAPCHSPSGSTTCAVQTTAGEPVLWSPTPGRHPYAITGASWGSYTVTADVMLPQAGSAGLIARFHTVSTAQGAFDGYVFDASTHGSFSLTVHRGGAAVAAAGGLREVRRPRVTQLAAGRVSFATGRWHTLTLTVAGTAITASVDGRQVASLADAALAQGSPGVEVGGWYPAYFSNLRAVRA
jgi:Glycosyl hydrolase family 59